VRLICNSIVVAVPLTVVVTILQGMSRQWRMSMIEMAVEDEHDRNGSGG
jgi:hypothetical protein